MEATAAPAAGAVSGSTKFPIHDDDDGDEAIFANALKVICRSVDD